jgi:hypothetical protein
MEYQIKSNHTTQGSEPVGTLGCDGLCRPNRETVQRLATDPAALSRRALPDKRPLGAHD